MKNFARVLLLMVSGLGLGAALHWHAAASEMVAMPSTGQVLFSGVHVGAVGAATNYLANPGGIATAIPLLAQQKFPSRAAIYKNLRARALVNPLASAVVVTLYKNGVATALTVTITAGSTALFKDTTDSSAFTADDDLDLVATSSAGGVATAVLVATVEQQ